MRYYGDPNYELPTADDDRIALADNSYGPEPAGASFDFAGFVSGLFNGLLSLVSPAPEPVPAPAPGSLPVLPASGDDEFYLILLGVAALVIVAAVSE